MAIYHFKSQIIKRSAGRSATSAAAYRARTTIRDDRTGLIFDYRHIKSASHCQILAPQNVPEWVYQRSALWNEVEKAEKRKDSQLAREIMVALPSELSRIEQIKLGAMFVHKTYVSKGMVADLAFHDLDTHNPHMHVMLTMRTIDSNGFGKKERSWNPQFKRGQANGDFLKEERQLWQDYVNLALKRAGHRVKVDCRSLAARGSNQVPQIHLGARANALEKIGIRTAYGDEHRRIALVNQEIVQLQLQKELILKEIEAEKQQQKEKIQQQQQELARQPKPPLKISEKSETKELSQQVLDVMIQLFNVDPKQIKTLPKEKLITRANRTKIPDPKPKKNPTLDPDLKAVNRSPDKTLSQSSNPLQSIPEKNRNFSANSPQNPTHQSGNSDNSTPQNQQSSTNYWGLADPVKSSTNTPTTSQYQTDSNQQPSPKNESISPNSSHSTNLNVDNARSLLRLGAEIYNQEGKNQQLINSSPDIWFVRGNNYTLTFNPTKNTFTIREQSRGTLVEAYLTNSQSKIIFYSAVSESDLNIFRAKLNPIEQPNTPKPVPQPKKSKNLDWER